VDHEFGILHCINYTYVECKHYFGLIENSLFDTSLTRNPNSLQIRLPTSFSFILGKVMLEMHHSNRFFPTLYVYLNVYVHFFILLYYVYSTFECSSVCPIFFCCKFYALTIMEAKSSSFEYVIKKYKNKKLYIE
jgi:hypothetical protein